MGVIFNIKKCNVISITNATKNKIHHQYTMDNEPLNSNNTCVYLGVTVNSRLCWNQHIDQISAAANRMLGFLRHTQHLTEKTYKANFHPKLEYCSSIWDPHQQKYIDKLEMTEHRAARFVKNIPFRRSKTPVSIIAMLSLIHI